MQSLTTLPNFIHAPELIFPKTRLRFTKEKMDPEHHKYFIIHSLPITHFPSLNQPALNSTHRASYRRLHTRDGARSNNQWPYRREWTDGERYGRRRTQEASREWQLPEGIRGRRGARGTLREGFLVSCIGIGRSWSDLLLISGGLEYKPAAAAADTLYATISCTMLAASRNSQSTDVFALYLHRTGVGSCAFQVVLVH